MTTHGGKIGAVVLWIREQIAECERVEKAPCSSSESLMRATAATQRRTLEAVLAKLEGRS